MQGPRQLLDHQRYLAGGANVAVKYIFDNVFPLEVQEMILQHFVVYECETCGKFVDKPGLFYSFCKGCDRPDISALLSRFHWGFNEEGQV